VYRNQFALGYFPHDSGYLRVIYDNAVIPGFCTHLGNGFEAGEIGFQREYLGQAVFVGHFALPGLTFVGHALPL
jgi:hypothetical protein